MKATRASIEAFLSSQKIAVAGVSRDPKKFGHLAYKRLKESGFEVFPVNPQADFIDGTPCFRSVSTLPLSVHSLLIITSKKHTRDIIAEAISKGIDNIWIQQGCETQEAIDLTKSHPVNLVTKECILMHAEPVAGVHKFHRAIRKFFGTFPK